MSNLPERRLLERTTLALYLPVVAADSHAPLGHLIDINITGFLMMRKDSLPIGEVYKVAIQIPSGIVSVTEIQCDMVVRRCSLGLNPTFQEIGCEITAISSEARGQIEELEQALLLRFGPSHRNEP
jgi:hypothetical protein